MPKNQFQRPQQVKHSHAVPRHGKPMPPMQTPKPAALSTQLSSSLAALLKAKTTD
jgi:hypothetical protein